MTHDHAPPSTSMPKAVAESTLATNLASYYAAGNAVVLADFDPRRSSLEWLAARPQDALDPPARLARPAAPAAQRRDTPSSTCPRGARGAELTALVRRGRNPSSSRSCPRRPISARRAFQPTTCCWSDEWSARNETGGGRQPREREHRAPESRRGCWGSRQRLHHGQYAELPGGEKFLQAVWKIPFITTLRENPTLVADASGLGIFDLKPSHVARDLDQCGNRSYHWLESRRSLPDPD